MIILDTNALIRFATKDLPEKARAVKTLLESDVDISIPDVVFPEIEYVLTGDYDFPKEKQVKLFELLLSLPNITISQQVRIAVKIFSDSKLDMADCIIAAYSMGEALASFDKELIKASGVKTYFK